MKIPSSFRLGLATLLVLTTPLRADDYVVDQHNEFDGAAPDVLFYSLLNIVSHGQEFRPTLALLDFVDLLLTHNDTNYPNGSVQALVRSNSISGPIVGASDLLVMSGTQPGVRTNRFRFSPRVQLSPGSNYVLEVVTFGSDFWGVGVGDSNAYPAGRMINGNSGQPEPGRDLWFREGVVNPAPNAVLLSIHFSHVAVCWSSSTNKTYQVQYRSALTTNLWTNLGASIPGNGFTNCVNDAIVSPSRIYRVVTLP